MKDKEKILLLLICLIIITVICVTIIIALQKKQEYPLYDENLIYEPVELKEEFAEIDNSSYFYTIKGIINEFVSYIKQVNGDQYLDLEKLKITEKEATAELQKEGINTIKEILDQQYIDDIQISDENLVKYLSQYKQKGNCKENVYYSLKIEDVLIKDINENVKLVLVKAQLTNKDFNILIKLDNENMTYSIFLEDYIIKYNYDKNMKKEDFKINDANIDSNGYNEYKSIIAEDEYVSIQLFNDFKNYLLNDSRTAYDVLDEEYREKKYGSYENFVSYIKQNREKLENIEIKMYNKKKMNGKTEYICLDAEGKYYIFTQDNIVNYDVILDTYTIDLPEFLEKYNNNSNNRNKIRVGLNLQKIFDAIKDEDYGYVYSKLDATFRNNNFKTEEDFVKYAEQNFANCQFKYSSCEETNNLYVAKVKITRNTGGTKAKEFIMKLQEGTDFVMSFNVN